MTHQALPSGATDADRIARQLARLRGPQIQPGDGTLVAEDLRVRGAVLAAARASVRRAVAQGHPRRATVDGILAELEGEYGLPVGAALPESERQARLWGRYLSRGDGSLPAVARTVRALVPDAALLAVAAPDVAGTFPAAVFNLVILVSLATLNDAAMLSRLDALLGRQLTSHVGWTFGRGDGPDLDAFRLDDPASLLEVDPLDL